MMIPPPAFAPRLRPALLFVALSGPALSQGTPQSEVLLSVDWQGPLIGQQTSPGTPPITEADLLIPSGPPFLSPPALNVAPGAFLSAYTQCVGHAPGFSCGVEVDAFSFGRDALLLPDPGYTVDLLFSVDEFATGLPTSSLPRSVRTEAAAFEAAGDVFVTPIATPGPQFVIGDNTGVLDGNGEGGGTQGGGLFPGIGLTEPVIPSPNVPETGDNLDGLEVRTIGGPAGPYFFSLEAGFTDPNQPNVPVADSASNELDPNGNPFQGGDVLVLDPQGQVLPYASADQLGLDRVGGPGSDDVDALVIRENGIPGYQPSEQPFDWLPGAPGGQRDLLLFSVRRGSAVLGQLDSRFNVPIGEGDVLGPPLPGASSPAIYYNAEAMGLNPDDDLDALDARDSEEDPIKDCNDNGVEDALDITNGASMDVDGNGVPDECEEVGNSDCDCDDVAESACGNTAGPDEGRLNNTGQGGRLRAIGTSSVFTDSLVLQASQLTPNTFGFVVFANGMSAGLTPPGNNGRLCLAPGAGGIFRIALEATGTAGAFTVGPGLLASATSGSNPATVTVGTTWGFQVWYRDLGGSCAGGFSNLTNAWTVTFTP
ncbi:MAG: hypothetical protein P8R46_14245 [Planctomycetota bacterium]|nr:hypothetical protein [Planctomycetota bacterium]